MRTKTLIKIGTIFVVVAVSMMVFCFIASAKTVEYKIGKGSLVFNTSTNTIEGSKGTLVDVTIPKTIAGVKVLKLGEQAFINQQKLRSVVIPEGVVEIMDGISFERGQTGAFYECKRLTSVKLPSTLKKIGSYTFSWCTSLKTLTLPKGLVELGRAPFYGCKVKNLILPDSLRVIRDGLLGGCEVANFPKNIEYVESLSSRDGKAFKNWYSKQPNGPVYIGKALYSYKGSMAKGTVVKLKEDTVSISIEAFSGQKNLAGIVMNKKLKAIGDNAFYGCTSLEKVTIPTSVTKLGSGVFTDSLWYNNQKDGVLYIGRSAVGYKGEPTKSTTIKEGTRLLSRCVLDRGYDENRKDVVEEVVLPTTIEYMDGAFLLYGGIKNLVIPEGVKVIRGAEVFSSWAFGERNGYTVTIPKSVTYIDPHAFYCSSIGTIGSTHKTDITIRGDSGSYAEKYAKANGFKFKAI